MTNTAQLKVYMLGGFEMYYDGVPLRFSRKLTSKPLQLLQLLLYNKEAGVSRRTVLEALYGQDTAIDAANNLNATVSQLRRLLRETHLPEGNYIHIRVDRYFFEGSVSTWVDTEEVVSLRQAADLSSGRERIEILYRLCDLYRGRFLPELDGESWVEIAKADYQRIYRDSLTEVCKALRDNNSHDEIIRLTSLAAGIFPFDEWQVWTQESLLACGRIRDAHNLYLQVEKLYMTELDSPPPEQMRARFRKPEKESWRRTESADSVRQWLLQANAGSSGCIPFPAFMYAYGMVSRMSTLGNNPYCLLICTLQSNNGRQPPAPKFFLSAMEKLEKVLMNSLRFEDVFTRYSRNQFLVLLPGAREENLDAISGRISNAYREAGILFPCSIDFQPISDSQLLSSDTLE